MPEGCTGIDLLDPKANFQKFNCKWVNWGTRNKKKKKDNGRVICSFSIEKEYYEYLTKQVLMKSRELGKRYHFSDLVREVLEKTCPFPKTMDMFGGKKKK